MDDADTILKGALEGHCKMIKQFRGQLILNLCLFYTFSLGAKFSIFIYLFPLRKKETRLIWLGLVLWHSNHWNAIESFLLSALKINIHIFLLLLSTNSKYTINSFVLLLTPLTCRLLRPWKAARELKKKTMIPFNSTLYFGFHDYSLTRNFLLNQ